jgi:hypothetical protein
MLITNSGCGNHPSRAVCGSNHCHTLGRRFRAKHFSDFVVNDFDVSRINLARHNASRMVVAARIIAKSGRGAEQVDLGSSSRL